MKTIDAIELERDNLVKYVEKLEIEIKDYTDVYVLTAMNKMIDEAKTQIEMLDWVLNK